MRGPSSAATALVVLIILVHSTYRVASSPRDRVASTPRGIFLVIISMRIFFPRIFFKIFPEKFMNYFN